MFLNFKIYKSNLSTLMGKQNSKKYFLDILNQIIIKKNTSKNYIHIKPSYIFPATSLGHYKVY